ncbi:TPA: peptide MFS transporter [Legionella pneumophila]|nr:peptide MFS transporter [Legionella pneumophila]
MIKIIREMPGGVAALCLIQAFSTFSYAVQYSSLALFITKQLGIANSSANGIVGLFLSFSYIFQLIGGVIGSRFISNRLLFITTILIQNMGLFFLAQAHPSTLNIGLSLFMVGSGLNVTSSNSMLTQCFLPQDDRRESAFFLSYAGMNIGYCVGYIACGFFDYSNQYQYLFYASILTNSIALLIIMKNWAYLADKKSPSSNLNQRNRFFIKNILAIAFITLLIPFMWVCFEFANFSNGLVIITCLFMFLIIFILGLKQKSSSDRKKMMAYLILAISSVLFWMIYLTGPMGVTLFVKNNVDKHLFTFELATQWIKNINPVVIILGAPMMAMLVNKLKAKGFHVSVPMQFSCSFMFLALSFLCLIFGIICSNSQGYLSVYWIISHHILQGMSELLLGPVGYALIGRIAPPNLQGILMGTWMLVTGVAASFSQYFSNAMVQSESVDPLITNQDFLTVFKQLGLWSLLCAILLYFVSGKLSRIINGTQDNKPVNESKVLPIPHSN